MKQSLRHQKIVSLVQQNGYISTEALVEQLKVTPQTIRRDLRELAEKNLLQRHHGGATQTTSTAVNAAYQERRLAFRNEKIRIARRVAEQIPDGTTLFIDIGTTPEFVAEALLNHKNLRIVTNNLNVALLFRAKEDCKVLVAGGEVRNSDGGILGETVLNFISQFRLDFGIIGISGIETDGSLLEFDYHEVLAKRQIIANSRTVFLVSDHSKYHRNAMVNLGNISCVNAFFTDQPPPKSIEQLLNNHDIALHIC